ncbi:MULTISPECIES: hypothetical protein [Legionella]|uniref:Coiled-coil protein n=1 Tax=Legionella resiliens TaxID=2905958 RepID=A0ABS8WY38_9GAMM|nr:MULTISPECIES: hypothetical protein [unclassified Legionella]MCE0722209.1 hypothetical protein [Legionella sp. 9fVS26]MCE3531363.1 hypothetical protein [Legionella sp. 8cVS16]QLZ67378.1 hypothetical protein FOLKNPGA_00143 [Legionella sp. PC1000]
MATSSAVLQSFLRDAFKDNKQLADLSFEDLLNYNRAECGLIQLDFLPKTFADLPQFTEDRENNDVVFLYEDTLYYGDKKSNRIRELKFPKEPKKPAKPPEPVELESDELGPPKSKKQRTDPEYLKYLEEYAQYEAAYSEYIKQINAYISLKNSCSETYKRAKDKNLDYIRKLTDRAYTEQRSNDFLPSLNFYLGILDKTDSVMFHYMNDLQKEKLAFNLKTTLLLLLAQKQHEIEYQKTENVNTYNQHIKRCSKLLMMLDPEYRRRIKRFQAEPLEEQPVKYLGIPLGQLLAKDMVDMPGGLTKGAKEFMGKMNEARLYWVWGSTFLKTVVGLLPDYMYAAQGPEAMKTPDFFSGNLSWILYYTRFFMELGLLFKHTIKGSWMSAEEAETPWQDRFLTQWSQRKFALMNDFFWGTANLLCYFKLNGTGGLGTAGDVLTLVLLVFDIAVAAWDFEEQRTKYNKAMLQYDEDLERLGKQLQVLKDKEAKEKLQDFELKEKRQVEVQIRTLEREKLKCYRDWQLQKVSLINNIAYAVGLMLAFIVLTAPFMPISAPVLGIMLIAGAAACLAFTIINNAIKGGIELYKTYKTLQEEKQDHDDKVKELLRLLRKNPNLNDNEKKLLYLEIKQHQAETEYQKQMMTYQSVNLARRIMIEALVPVVVLVSLVAVPLGGLGIIPVLIAAIALAIATQMLVDALFKPEEKKALEFDEDSYKKFCNELGKQPKIERGRLFTLGEETSPLLDNKLDDNERPGDPKLAME